MPRPIRARIDLAALRHNLGVARSRAAGASVYAVVKANAYGHGLDRVRPALAAADGLALLELDAAVRLRESGWTRPVLLLEGCFDPDELATAARLGLESVVHSVEQARALAAAALPAPLTVHVKVNTGMNRLGLAPTELPGVLDRLAGHPNVREVVLMTHFARAEERDGLALPLARFERARAGRPLRRSLANSAAVLRYPEVGGEVVRPGIMLYGASPFPDRSAAELGLEPVMTLESELIAVRELAAGDEVGYGGSWRAERARRIGIVACGYADGYPRHAPSGTPVSVDGVRTGTVGRVSMDMIAVELSPVPGARPGSPVVLWGRGNPVDEVATAAGTVSYELLCAVAPRVPYETVGSA